MAAHRIRDSSSRAQAAKCTKVRHKRGAAVGGCMSMRQRRTNRQQRPEPQHRIRHAQTNSRQAAHLTRPTARGRRTAARLTSPHQSNPDPHSSNSNDGRSFLNGIRPPQPRPNLCLNASNFLDLRDFWILAGNGCKDLEKAGQWKRRENSIS